MIKLLVPFYMPKVLYSSFARSVDKNPLHDGMRNLTGKNLSALSGDFNFKDVKNTAHSMNETINDLLTSCVVNGIKKYFEMKGDN
jgi:hypothetical protein